MDFDHSPKAQDYIARLERFMEEHIYPVEQHYMEEVERLNPDSNWRNWKVPSIIEPLKEKAKAAGLWNLFLPDAELAEGLSVTDYAPLAEITGRVLWSPEVFNCNAPDTGNMEVLYHFGSEAQKQQWLTPLLAGEIRSVFGMTEPDVASSDATNMQATIVEDGDEVVINGRKWWTTGLGHPNAKVAIVMGLTDPEADRHRRHSMVLVPLDAPGVKIERMLPCYSHYDAPYGHGEMSLTDVRVPKSNVIMGLGAGFAIAQGRLGPGRIHHCMRAIGAAERSLELMIKRGASRIAFGKPLIKLNGNQERIAEARLAIDQARLLTLNAAWKIDKYGVQKALTDISAIKVAAPRMLQMVSDMAIQMHGGAGVSHDLPLAGFASQARMLRLADGPDEVHLSMLARLELAKYRDHQRADA